MDIRRKAWYYRLWYGITQALRWLVPGLGVKRWLALLLAGITFIGVGLALFLLDIYRTAPETWWLPIIRVISLQSLDRTWRIVIFGSIGLSMLAVSVWGLNRSLMIPFLRPGRSLVDQVAEYRRRERGPRVVVIGGGHGLATVLRGLKAHTHNLTAVVSVADDGGSSGELRRSLGILPPGDIRNCLAALSDDEGLLTQLFQYRFSKDSSLSGHSFGNLLISALVDITGSFEEAIVESGRVLSVHGRVLPSTLHDVRLVADVQLPNQKKEVRVEGESLIPQASGKVRRLWLEPSDASAFPPVIQAILAADMIVIGPGSLYTSLLPNLLVRDVIAALHSAQGIKIFVCNISTQSGETETYSCSDHVEAIEDSLASKVLDIVVCNHSYEGRLATGVQWVKLDELALTDSRIYTADLIDQDYPWRHDAAKLAETLMNLYFERTGPLDRDLNQEL